MNIYLLCAKIISVLKIRNKTSIVVIGANDGKINDPIFPFIKAHAKKTRILLVEPNKYLNQFIRKNFEFHPEYQISNYAIGGERELMLFAIKPDYFQKFQPDYAQKQNWPSYRAATGITSANRMLVEDSLFQVGLSPEECIAELRVPSSDLISLLLELSFPASIDILQIDAEGYDDEVIYASNLELTKPRMILFENDSLTIEKIEKLHPFLALNKYIILPLMGSTLCIRKDWSLLFFLLLSAFLARRLLHFKRRMLLRNI